MSAVQPCNPAVGGPAKSQLVHEVDALGGEMGKMADKCYLQKRILNRSKVPISCAVTVTILCYLGCHVTTELCSTAQAFRERTIPDRGTMRLSGPHCTAAYLGCGMVATDAGDEIFMARHAE